MVAVSVFALYFATRAGRQAAGGLENDFGVYYRASRAIAEGRDLYRADENPTLTFKYAPVVALAWVPLSSLPPVPARVLWCLVDLALIAWCFRVGFRIVGGERSRRRGLSLEHGGTVAVTVLLAVLPAVLLTLGHIVAQVQCGQSTSLWLLLVLLAFEAMRRGELRSGPLLAAAICIKCVPIAIAPYYLATRRPLAGLASLGASVAGLLLVPAIWVGWQRNTEYLADWPRHLAATEVPEQFLRSENQSVLAQAARWTVEDGERLAIVKFGWLSAAIGVAGGLYAWILLTRRAAEPGLHLSMLLVFVTLFNPLAWRYNFLAMLVPNLYVLTRLGAYWKAEWQGGGRGIGKVVLCCGLLVGASVLNTVPLPDGVYANGGRIWGTMLLVCAVLTASDSRRSEWGFPGVLRTFRPPVGRWFSGSGA